MMRECSLTCHCPVCREHALKSLERLRDAERTEAQIKVSTLELKVLKGSDHFSRELLYIFDLLSIMKDTSHFLSLSLLLFLSLFLLPPLSLIATVD